MLRAINRILHTRNILLAITFDGTNISVCGQSVHSEVQSEVVALINSEMSPHSIILLGVLQFTAKGLSSTVPMNSAASNGNKELDSATSQSNHQPQYVLPPPSNHPMPIMHPNLVPQYPGPPQQQQLSSGYGVMDDIKSDISTLRDSVLLLSNLVKQNSMNSEGRTLYPNDNSKYEKPDYRPGDTGYYDSPAPKKGYKDEAVKAK